MTLGLFGVNEKSSIARWWSILILALLGWLTAVFATNLAQSRSKAVNWWVLAAGFVCLSMDEGAMIKERIGYSLSIDDEFHNARWMLA